IEEIEVCDFKEYNDTIDSFGEDQFIFRGVGKSDYNLLPNIGRRGKIILDRELELFDEFKMLAYPYLKRNSIDVENELEFLTIAQHHGLPIRLLDWSKNPLIATYFSVYNNENSDGALYVLDINTVPSIKDALLDEEGKVLNADISFSSDI